MPYQRSDILFVFLILLLCQCSNESYDPLYKGHTTKIIVDKKGLVNEDSARVAWRRKFSNPGTFLPLDTFALIKPLITVQQVNNDNWFGKPEMLDANIPKFELKNEINYQNLYELDWLSYIHKNFYENQPHYIASISPVDFEILTNEINKMTNALDRDSLISFAMTENMAKVLSQYSAQYYILFSMKERYWNGPHPYYKGANNFYRMRVFIFNAKTGKILYYKRIYNGWNGLPYSRSSFQYMVKDLMKTFHRTYHDPVFGVYLK